MKGSMSLMAGIHCIQQFLFEAPTEIAVKELWEEAEENWHTCTDNPEEFRGAKQSRKEAERNACSVCELDFARVVSKIVYI